MFVALSLTLRLTCAQGTFTEIPTATPSSTSTPTPVPITFGSGLVIVEVVANPISDADSEKLLQNNFLDRDEEIVIFNTGTGLKYLDEWTTQIPQASDRS